MPSITAHEYKARSEPTTGGGEGDTGSVGRHLCPRRANRVATGGIYIVVMSCTLILASDGHGALAQRVPPPLSITYLVVSRLVVSSTSLSCGYNVCSSILGF
mmetsp:Transcript_17205/g.52008  ORF Transcript_17205/g.52008 Transcript_17205/m.52008 type:complete len:102 (-) Transcript_17205:290-595(-)